MRMPSGTVIRYLKAYNFQTEPFVSSAQVQNE
jgi:hypothetical protein